MSKKYVSKMDEFSLQKLASSNKKKPVFNVIQKKKTVTSSSKKKGFLTSSRKRVLDFSLLLSFTLQRKCILFLK